MVHRFGKFGGGRGLRGIKEVREKRKNGIMVGWIGANERER